MAYGGGAWQSVAWRMAYGGGAWRGQWREGVVAGRSCGRKKQWREGAVAGRSSGSVTSQVSG
eukprot:363067-Chlamydomonas_euryale.AAC.6